MLSSLLQISIHALREEGDCHVGVLACTGSDFYPRPPRGGRHFRVFPAKQSTKFLSTPSARRATVLAAAHKQAELISIHALREEGDQSELLYPTASRDFYPRPPRGGRLFSAHPGSRRSDFYPRPPRGGRLPPCRRCRLHCDFYPRPPRGGRPTTNRRGETASLFLSTPSARRATCGSMVLSSTILISIHALREEGDRTTWQCLRSRRLFLSTPSARRATCQPRPGSRPDQFLSTPSARRATCNAWSHGVAIGISIHALREEGDAGHH